MHINNGYQETTSHFRADQEAPVLRFSNLNAVVIVTKSSQNVSAQQ